MKKVLLGTSALVAAAVISSPASANVELEITGAVDWQAGIVAGDDGADNGERRDYDMSTDWDITLTSTGTTDNGLTYGTVVNLDDGGGNDIDVDEAFVAVSGDFGRFALGDDDPAASVLRYGVESAGSGLADGDYSRYVIGGNFSNGTDFVNSSDDTKITYTGAAAGFSFGLSFSPTDAGQLVNSATGDMNQANTSGGKIVLDDEGKIVLNEDGTDVSRERVAVSDYENLVSAGAKYEFEFDGGSIGFSGGINYAGNETSGVDDLFEWGIGTILSTGGFGLQGFFINSGDHTGAENHLKWGAGMSYSMDSVKFAANYLGSSFDAQGNAVSGTNHAIGGGATYSLAPGLSVYGEVVYQTFSADVAAAGIDLDFDSDATIVLVGASASY